MSFVPPFVLSARHPLGLETVGMDVNVVTIENVFGELRVRLGGVKKKAALPVGNAARTRL